MEDLYQLICSSSDDENDWKSTSQALQWEPLPNPSWAQGNNQPEKSNGVVPLQNPTSVSTAQASQSPNISSPSLLGRNLSSLSEYERVQRKRKTDKEYRARCKKNKMEMQLNLLMLTKENESLKMENVCFKSENALMNQTLRDQATDIGCLRSDLFQLKCEHEKQNVLVETLLGHLADPVRLKYEKLKDENAALRMNVNLNINLTQLAVENAKLRIDNKVLKVQNDALCGKIISDKDKKCEQEQ